MDSEGGAQAAMGYLFQADKLCMQKIKGAGTYLVLGCSLTKRLWNNNLTSHRCSLEDWLQSQHLMEGGSV